MAHESFPRAKQYRDGRFEYVLTAKCGRCGFDGSVPAQAFSGEDGDATAKLFRRQGWHIAGRAAGDLCPRCFETPQRKPNRQTCEAVQAEVEAKIVNLIAPPPAPSTQEPVMAEALPPRQPTREQRRAIQDKLEAHYDVKRGCYLKAFTDKALAESMMPSVPVAWVAEMRELLFGAEVNEASLSGAKEWQDLADRAAALDTLALELCDKIDKLRTDIAANKAKHGLSTKVG